MSVRIDLTGKRFGSWVVRRYVGANKIGHSCWLCICDCGTERDVAGQTLRNGTSVSCGCTKGEAIRIARTTHGQAGNGSAGTKSREYRAWEAMKRRTVSTGPRTWPYYGRWGIKVCKRWKDSFQNFLEDMGKCPKGFTLDRIDCYGHYEPANCRWADWKTQRANQRPRR